jgi:hypothetical protein
LIITFLSSLYVTFLYFSKKSELSNIKEENSKILAEFASYEKNKKELMSYL